MTAGPRIEHYDWAGVGSKGAREAMLRFGPEGGPTVIAALPLFEEANRTRAFVVAILRSLGDRGIGGVLPDLPGQGESMVPTEQLRLATLRLAHAAAAARAGATHGLALRGGALVDVATPLLGHWRLAPSTGAEQAAELRRLRLAAGGLSDEGGTELVPIAGNQVARAFLDELGNVSVAPQAPIRVVRLSTDPRPADRAIDAAPLWRRSEPDNDSALATLLADDIAGWIATCAG